MSEPVNLNTDTPEPPWNHRTEDRRNFLQRLSDRTPLRTKLIAAVLALVIMALAVISVVSVILLRSDLYTQRDKQLDDAFGHLESQAGSLLLNPQFQLNTAYEYELGLAGIQQVGSQIAADGTGGTLPGSGNSSMAQSIPRLPTGQWAGSSTPELITAPEQSGGDTWRVIGQAVSLTNNNTGKQQTAIVFLAVDLGPVGAEIQRLILVELIVSTAIVIVLAIVGVGVVRANLRPLDDIEMTAGQIAAGHLDHRVPEGDPRTEVGSLGRSLNAMLTQIERAFHAQEASEQAAHESEERMRRFIADASHELRTPLTTIRGFAAHYRMRGGAGGRRGVGVGVGAAGSAGAAGGFGGGPSDPSSRTDALVPGSANDTSPGGPANDDGMSPADLDHLIGRVEAEATRMGLLVEDLLTLARLDQQRPLNVAPVDLLTLAADAVQDARMVSPDRPIDLIVAPGTAFLVDGDEPRLRQVLGNLVNNALTHTPAGTPVRVKIASGTLPTTVDDWSGGPASVDEDAFAGGAGNNAATSGRAVTSTGGSGFAGSVGNNGAPGGRPVASAGGYGFAGGAGNNAAASGRPAASTGGAAVAGGVGDSSAASGQLVPAVVLDVEDDGPGMPAEQAQRVFERFYRADAARNRASGGTGLGLAIVAGLVNAHGGTVSVRTAPGRGADFQVRLPLSPDALAPSDDPDDTVSD